MGFEWLPLTWNDVATFLTGFAAVGGAVFVGRKQLQITKLQTAIQKDQAIDDRKLRQQSIKLELLDRRQECISRLRKLDNQYKANASFTAEEFQILLEIIEQAILIFPADVTLDIGEIIFKENRKQSRLGYQARLRERGQEDEADRKLDEAFALESEVFDAIPKTLDRMVVVGRITDWD